MITRTKVLASAFGWVKPVYIRSVGAYLPNDPVPNSDVEKHIGSLDLKGSGRVREKTLSMNGIKTRHYAMVEGKPTHLNADLAVNAIQDALERSDGISVDQVGQLAAGTTSPDVLVPGFANLVHGKLGTQHSLDCLSSSGVCISSLNALKAAAHSVTLGEHSLSLVVGSETSSHGLHAARYDTDKPEGIFDAEEAFMGEFLRYMLSDGAGCALLDVEPHPTKLSFRIEKFYHHSLAHETSPGMVCGVPKAGVPIKVKDIFKINTNQQLVLRQDTKLMSKEIKRGTIESLKTALGQGFLGDQKVDWMLPHFSSYLFYDQIVFLAREMLGLPEDRIWTNLSSVGNVGAASIFLNLWAVINSSEGPDIKDGDRVLLFVPESGNFSFHYVLLTAVSADG